MLSLLNRNYNNKQCKFIAIKQKLSDNIVMLSLLNRNYKKTV